MTAYRQLRYELQVRKNRVLKADFRTAVDELIIFFDFLKRHALLRGLLEELHHNLPNYDEWRSKMGTERRIIWPGTEEERVGLCLAFLDHCVNSRDPDEPMHVAHTVGAPGTHLPDHTRFYLEHFFMPFYEYLDGHIEEYSSVLYIIEKFKLQTQWFEQERLFKLYLEDTSRGEKILDKTLRRYLFDHGIDYPFSTPASPSGRADIVASLHTPEPVIVEVKVFDPSNERGRAYIRQGFRQVYEYTSDYSKTIGYLMIFNVCDKDLQFRLTSSEKPQRVELDDKVIFLVIVDLFCDERPASQRGPLELYVIEESYLTS